MIFSRTGLFMIVLCLVVSPFLVPKIIWLSHSRKATGVMRFVGKSYTGQLIHFYSFISFPLNGDTVWFRSNDNTIFEVGEKVPVRFQANDPSDAKVDRVTDVWSDTIVYGTGPLIILTMIFFHPKGIPRSTRFRFRRHWPFIQLA